MKLLLVEDEIGLADSIQVYLARERYRCEWAKDYHEAEMKIEVFEYDGALVDITLPGGNGLQLVEALKRKNPATFIIIISAKNSIEDKVKGLDLGADDYLTKPFHLAELNSRIKSVWRRRKHDGNMDITFEEIRITPEEYQVYIHDQPVSLTRKEFDLLLFFISNKNRVLTKNLIAEHICGDQAELLDSVDFIYTHIKNLRKKLIEKGASDYIHTMYGTGYKFGIA